MKNLSTYFVHITSGASDEFPREKNIKSWLPEQYSNAEYKILHGDLQDELIKYIESIPDSVVVMGSFGRSEFSRFFHKSLANTIITKGKSTLFITHK